MLAADIAADIWDPDVIFERHGISDSQRLALLGSDWFQAMIQEAKTEWSSLKNSKARVRLKGQLALEEAIPTIFQMINDIEVPATARVAAFKELKDLSGVAGAVMEGSVGNGLPSVTIYLGTPEKTVTIAGSKQQNVEEAITLPGLEILESKDQPNP